MLYPLIPTTVGVELEYVGATDMIADRLSPDGWLTEGGQHSYHCGCATCVYATGCLWRYQRDSTVSGEFITGILHDWATARFAFKLIEDAITEANAAPRSRSVASRRIVPPIQVNQSTGLHVHVGTAQIGTSWASMCEAYLLYERWMQRIGSGPFADKREGMNITFLNALREQGHENSGQRVRMEEAGDAAQRQVRNDRHIDLNWSRSNQTYEFRVFNGTMEAWQMELAVRLAVAFTLFAGRCPKPREIRIPARAIATLQPPLTLAEFINSLCELDYDLRPLIERQMALYPERGDEEAVMEQPEPEPEPEPIERFSGTRGTPSYYAPTDDSTSAILGCTCSRCEGLRTGLEIVPTAQEAF